MDLLGRNVLAYFTRREEAERARFALRQEGFDVVQLDRIGLRGGESARPLHNFLTSGIGSPADLSVSAADDGVGSDPLLAADSAVSDLAHGLAPEHDTGPGTENPAWLVSVLTGEDRVNRAVQILEDSGGVV